LAASILVLLITAVLPTQEPFTQDVVAASDATVKPRVHLKQLPSYVGAISTAPEGQFRVEFIVERNGSVKEARVVRAAASPAYGEFENTTLGDIRRWKFQPGEKDGKPVRVLASMTITFVRGQLPGRGGVREGVIGALAVDGVDDDLTAPGLAHMAKREPGLVLPVLKKQTKPGYPIADRTTASVELEVIVLTTGKIGAVQIVRSTDARFNDEAARGARQWEFQPATRNGQPVPIVVGIVLDFRK
jgi:TonB family protein